MPVGETTLSEQIPGYVLGLNLGSDPISAAQQRPSMLITGDHHARELTTISMGVYTIMRLLYDVVHQDADTMYLLQNTAVLIVPVVNWDGYVKISDHYEATDEMYWIRKNRNQYSSQTSNCGIQNIGVDLNRNYDY